MTKRPKKRRTLRVLTTAMDRREVLERELLWNIALGGDHRRNEQLKRMLTPAANDHLGIV